MDNTELGRQVGNTMRDAFPDLSDINLSAAIREQRSASSLGTRRAVMVLCAAACVILLAAAVVLVRIVVSRDAPATVPAPTAALQSPSPNPTPSLATDKSDLLTFRYPATWVSVPPGGPPTPGLASIGEYLTNATVVHGCAARRTHGASPLRCSTPVRILRPGQVLVAISEGTFAREEITPARIVHGHRTSTQYGQITSLPTAALDCPTGATNYLQMAIDDLLATHETRTARRGPFSGYDIYACINSATGTIPATIKQMISSVRITN